MKDLARRLQRALAAAIVFSALSACGGGGGTAVSPNPQPDLKCEPCVLSGFQGDLDWELARAPGVDGLYGGDGGGIGGGGDGEGGVGVGGSLGQFKGALVIARFADGTEFGRALTDDVAGMVTIRPGRTYAGPLLVEIHGQPGATYFEEGKNVGVPFEPGRVLRAIVPSISRNIGITPFSEAGYQLAAKCQAGDGPVQVCGQVVDATGATGNATVPTPGTIHAANAHVTGVLNQQFPNTLRVDDVTRLPFIVGEGTPGGAIADTPRGRYGLANIAFSKQAAMYNSTAAAPTLLATEQLSRDLLDGRLDGLSGPAPAGAAGQRTYDPQTLTSELTAALAQQTTRYGDSLTIATLPAITAFGNTRYDSYYFDATLEPSGATSTIAVATESASDRRAPGQVTTYVGPNRPDSRGFMLYGNMGSGSLFIKTDAPDSNGGLLAVGDNRNGELGDGTEQSTGPAGPARLVLPGVLTHVAGGIAHTVARLADGSVYAWGDNSLGQLGQGQNGASLPRSPLPRRVPLPAGAVAVAAANQASFALLEDSSVWSWGSGWGFGTLGDNTAAGERVSPAPVLSTIGPLTGVVQISARDNDVIALKSDGSVWTWGSFSTAAPGTGDQTSGVTPGRVVATRIDGIPVTTGGVRKVLTEQGLFAVLLAGSDPAGTDLDGAVYAWGIHFDITAGKVLRDLAPVRVLNLPPVRDLMPGGFLGYGQRPSDRLTGMGIDYDGRLFKVRGRVAEHYDPANPTAQRRPQGQAPREDCASCHVVRPKTLPPVPTTGATCAIPGVILSLLTTQSQCENCHNSAPLSTGRALGPLTCVSPPLPPPAEPTRAPVRTNRCALPVAHPVVGTNASCASCHNSVVTAPLSCSPDLTPLLPPSTTVPTITRAIDDVGPVTAPIGNQGVTDDTTPTLAGTLSAPLAAGEIVNVLRGGAPIGAAAASPGATTWQFTVPALATGASYTFTARVDRNGASSGAASPGFVLQISNQGPAKAVQITAIQDDVAPVTGNVAGGTTNDPAPTISGTITPALVTGEAVQLRRVGPGTAVVVVPATTVTPSTWSYSETGLANGATYSYSAQPIGPSGAGALGTPVNLTVDTALPTAQPSILVSADAPGGGIAAARGVRSTGAGVALGVSDATPQIRATVTGAAAGDQIEFLWSINGGAFTRVTGTSLVDVPASGSVTTANQTHTVGSAAAVVGTPTVAPDGTSLPVVYQARLVDRAGNVGQPGTAVTHRFGLFGCADLKAVKNEAQNSAHANYSDGAGTCAGSGCHAQATANGRPLLRLPGGDATSTSYWCTFGTGANDTVRLR